MERPSYGPIRESSSSPGPSSPDRRFSTQDLELVFHYTMYTSLGLATSKSDEELWQLIVPERAFSNNFLLYGLLSISALHLAYLRPSKAEFYRNIGVQHYNSAKGFLKPVLQGFGSGNTEYVASFVPLIASISFAMLRDSPSTETDYLEVVLANFRSLRAVKESLQNIWPSLETDPVGLFCFMDTGNTADFTGANIEAALEALEWRVQTVVELKHLRIMYLGALHYLRHCLQHKVQVLIWPLLVSDNFFQAMTEREPAAVAILCLYGTLLHMLETLWWVGDTGSHIEMGASKILPPEWKNSMRWARTQFSLPK